MNSVSARLVRIVDSAEANLRQVPDEDSAAPILQGETTYPCRFGSCKQIVGHLIDSASNNHQRFVRAALQGSLEFPGYDQDGCVHVQSVQQAPWPALVALWAAYNRYLAHVIAYLPPEKLAAPCRIGSGQPVTLGFLVEDYVNHLLHHLSQIGAAPSDEGGTTH